MWSLISAFRGPGDEGFLGEATVRRVSELRARLSERVPRLVESSESPPSDDVDAVGDADSFDASVHSD